MMPDHLLQLAILADRPGSPPGDARRVAGLMMRHLPVEGSRIVMERQQALVRETTKGRTA